ncbi:MULTISPECIES: exosporium protein D [unclassified Sutcliffiella]|uniref:exosporium protein D n=1 Tax=unclassified Sutcliffiella TaxID=2837532 RepID=UPI0030CB5A17
MTRKHHNDSKADCKVETHTVAGSGANLTGNIPYLVQVPPGSDGIVVFEDYTCNHNKTFLQLTSVPGGNQLSPVDLEVTIQTRGSRFPITAIVPGGPDIGGTRAFQVEDFESLSVSNPDDIVPGRLAVFIQKTFCICCDN